MNDVKKTWCAPAWLLDPERLERQLDRLSAEGCSSRARAGFPSAIAVERRMSTATVCSTSTSPATVRGTTMCAALPSWALSWSWTSGAFSSCADGTTARRLSSSPTSTRGSRARSAIFGRAACSRRFGWSLRRARCAGRRCGTGASSNMPRTLRRRAGSTFHACGRRASLRTLFSVCCGLSWASAFSGRRTAPQSGSAGCGRRGLSKNKRSAAPASCVSLCDFYRISMRECRGANGKNGLPFRGKRL